MTAATASSSDRLGGRGLTGFAGLAGLVALLALTTQLRPFWPLDETRYVGVAWEMWQRGDFLVPHLNGAAYDHKPPLLFWLIHAGWAVFGVNGWWPRLVSPLFALATLALAGRLQRLLWPNVRGAATGAGWIVVACPLFAYFGSALMFDVMLACFVALGCVGIATAWRGGPVAGFVLLGLGMAGALYAKGPVGFVHLLPLALAAPWWMREQRPRWSRWYAGVGLAVLGAGVSILAWAVPAAVSGGPVYRDAIFWGQSAGRMVESFAHRAPWYFYVVALPWLFAPWLLWPRWWGVLRRGFRGESGVRFAAFWALSCLIFFSAVSGKRWHYLLPEFVAFALLVARGAAAAAGAGRWRLAVPAATVALFGVAQIAIGSDLVPAALRRFGAGGAALVASGAVGVVAAAWLIGRSPTAAGPTAADDVRRVGAAMTLAIVAALFASATVLRWPLAGDEVARRLATYEREGRPVGFEGRYEDQWTYAARLTRPIAELRREDMPAWLAAHPDGRLVFLYREPGELPAATRVEHDQLYRGGRLALLAPR